MTSHSFIDSLCHISPKENTPVCGACCTRIENLGVRYGELEVLHDVHLHIHCGQLTAIIGPNGGGKTTLLRAILGQIKHTGEIHFIDGERKRPDRPVIGYVPQKMDVDKSIPMSVMDLFSCALSNKHPLFLRPSRIIQKKAVEALQAVQADHLLNRRLGYLSGGEMRRVLLALALAPLPHILLLDEPLAGMDLSGTELFYRIVSNLRKRFDLAILLVSHDLAASARVADQMIFLNKTIERIGSPVRILNDPLVRKTLSLDFNSNWNDFPQGSITS